MAWDDLPPTASWDELPPPKKKEKFNAMDWAMQSSGMNLSPAGLINTGYKTAQSVAAKAGNFATNEMQRRGYPSPLPQMVGTATKYAPDALMMIGPPAAAEGIVKDVPEIAVPLARRAIGLQKRFLMTPFARRQATQAAATALENDVIPLSGNPQTTLDRATALANKAGNAIGGTLKKIEFSQIAPEAEKDLEVLRQQLTKGTERGLFASANKPINRIKSTILELYGRNATAQDYSEAKNVIGKSLNYLSDQNAQGTNKKIVRAMAETIRKSVSKVLPEEFPKFLENQRLFNAADVMKKGLNNEIAGQQGNILPSITGTITAAANIAAGNPGKALAELGAVELLKRRGAGTAARLATNIANAENKLPAVASVLAKPLGRSKAIELFKQALKETGGDEKKARKLANEKALKQGFNTDKIVDD